MGMADFDRYIWIKKYNPQKRIFTNRAYRRAKRAFDLLAVLLSTPIWLPVFVFVALLIFVTSPGAPIIFNQLRTGRGGRTFSMFKFRTMVPNAQELKEKYAHLNELQWPDFKITNDPRITPLGRILRKTSLDELPQLLNVIRGEMSLVGPRPTSFGPGVYKFWQTEGLDVLPGMTGLWQLIGRGMVEIDDRLILDIAYTKHRCMMLDFEILVRTVIAVLKMRGAH